VRQADTSDPTLPDQLNNFYARFERNNTTQPVPVVHGDNASAFTVSESDVKRCFLKLKERKAAGPDCITPRLLKTCASQLAYVSSSIFNRSLHTRHVPKAFKKAVIIPIPKKSTASVLNDYRPVALTAVAMKCFERLVLKHIKALLPPDFDPHQFAYRCNRSVEDAICLALHTILQHLEKPSTYVRILFIDYSLAFNTIVPAKLHSKLLDHLHFPGTLADWILDFLVDREQTVKIQNARSSPVSLSTGAPQGCVLSPMLYSIFTHDCVANSEKTAVIKFADDTTICGLITGNDARAYREQIQSTVEWCSANNLELNITKTKEMVIDFRVNKNEKLPLTINGQHVEEVSQFKFLGTFISNDLKWRYNCMDIIKKARQRLFFLRSLSSFRVQKSILVNFYRTTVESVLTRSILVWFGSATQKDITKMNSVIRAAERIIGTALPSLHSIYIERCMKRTRSIINDITHPAHDLFTFLRSGRRLRTFYGNKRLLRSFYPCAVRTYNSLSQ
jgi:hypothetical protein